MVPRPLDGKCALVTGSTQGLGLAAARALAAAGCNVVLNGFGPADAIQASRDAIEAGAGVRTAYFAADLREPQHIAEMVGAATSAFGGIDIVINNAVVRCAAPVEEFAAGDWDEAVAVNLSAAFHTTRLVVPRMKQNRWGRIINVSSIYGLRGAANRVGYVTTKTALIGLTRAVALETVGHGITCNAICPGTTDTPVHRATLETLVAAQGLSPDEAERILLEGKQPTGRLIPAERVAALIVFLCGPEAGDITGAALPIDGGWSAGS